jgi:hypothetical protein
MLFLLGGRKNPAIRAIVGALLVVVGIVIHGGAILVGVGAVLLAWAGLQALKARRIGRQAQVTNGGRMS